MLNFAHAIVYHTHQLHVCYCAQIKPTVGEEEGGRERDGKNGGEGEENGRGSICRNECHV